MNRVLLLWMTPAWFMGGAILFAVFLGAGQLLSAATVLLAVVMVAILLGLVREIGHRSDQVDATLHTVEELREDLAEMAIDRRMSTRGTRA